MSLVKGRALLRAARLLSDEESGASIVEFALLTPLVFMLVFGMLTGGLAWNSKQALTQSAREAARYAATLPTTTANWSEKVSDRAVQSAFGELDPAVPGRYVCVAYLGPPGGPSKHEIGTSPTGSSLCPFPDGRGSEARAQVVVARNADLQAVLFNHTLTLQSDAVTRHEVSQ